MNKEIENEVQRIKQKKSTNRSKRLLIVVALVTLVCMLAVMTFPAFTLTRGIICGMEEHTHGEECYSEVEIEEATELVCGLEAHVHDETCCDEEGNIICSLDEHEHTAACYEVIPAHTETILSCEKTEHIHTDSCYDVPVEPETVFCGCAGHTHNDSCYLENGTLLCTLPEHVHTPNCYSNPNADLESQRTWEASLQGIELTENWSKDVLAIAQSQLGYNESERNYFINENGVKKGYSRYGAWYGDPYGDWCAMFCSFCLHYAGVSEELFPIESNCQRWVEKLSDEALDRYYPAGTYTPAPGDLIFFDYDTYEQVEEREANHIGLVCEVIGSTEQTPAQIKAIEGNTGCGVSYTTYDLDDDTIMGYGALPVCCKCSQMTITASAADGAMVEISGFLPEGAEAEIVPIAMSRSAMEESFGASKAAAMTDYVAYDITIYVDGEPWQPERPVSVSIVEPDIDLSAQSAVSVAHIETDGGRAMDVLSSLHEDGTVEFAADGFSVYVIYRFTVDFHFNGCSFSIPGNGTILLSDLLRALQIPVSVEAVADVSFSNDVLIAITRSGADWLLESLEPFTSEELLTLTMADGSLIEIYTTDAMPANLPTLTIRNGSTTTLDRDYAINATVNITRNTTLDLNGHDLYVTCDPLFNVTDGTLTIKNSGKLQYTETVVADAAPYGNIGGYDSAKPFKIQSYALSNGTSYSAWGDGALKNLFDDNSGTKLGGSVSNGTLSIDFETEMAQTAYSYSLTAASDTGSYTDRAPKSWTLYAQNARGTWVTLSTGNEQMTSGGKEYKFTIANPAAYQKYRITFQTNASMQMAELRLYPQAEEGLVYYVTETEVTNEMTGATAETVKKYSVSAGGMIIGNDANRAITISGGTLNLEGGIITGFNVSGKNRSSEANVENSAGGAIRATGGTVNLTGAVITGNAARDGGAIYAGGDSVLNISGGVISGNSAIGNGSQMYGGGGVYAFNSTVNMTGGYVTNNLGANPATPCRGGGGFMVRGATLNLSGGYVTGNSAPGGGAIMTYRVNSYDLGGKVYVTGGFITANCAATKEGGGVSLDGYGYMKFLGGYLTNNVCGGGIVNGEVFGDWGGGGIFVSDYQALLYVENALVTENRAGGFGGGIAGCSTGRLNIAIDEVCANYNNTALGTYLSGTGNAKNEDHLYAYENETFMSSGYQDYYCALSSVVSGGMLGGGTSMWTGTADGRYVSSTSRDDVLTAGSVMGLTAHPSESDILKASQEARVFINGNESPTHGGGILANGYLLIGPQMIESSCRLRFEATKHLVNGSGGEVSLGSRVFKFVIADEYGTVFSTGTSDSTGKITFDNRIGFTKEGTYTYYAYELTPDVENGKDIIPDTAKYEILVTVAKDTSVISIDGDNYRKNVYRFENVKITELSTKEVTYNGKPGNDETHAVSLDPTGGKAFTNLQDTPDSVTVKKVWAQGSTSQPVQMQLYRNGTPYGDKVTLNAANNWTYTWANLPGESIYTVLEDSVTGYLTTYSTSYGQAESYFVPATGLTAGNKYILVNPNGNYAMTANGSIGRTGISQKTGTLRLDGNTYTKWYETSAVSANSILTAESGVKLKTASNQYLRSRSSGLDMNTSSNASNYELDSSGRVKRSGQSYYISYSSSAFTQTTNGTNAAVLYQLVGTNGLNQLVTVTNTPLNSVSFHLNILKVDQTDHTHVLPDACFELQQDGNALHFSLDETTARYSFSLDAAASTELKTGNDGYIRIDGLKPGEYTLVEVKAPVGFRVADPISVVIDESAPGTTLSVTVEDPVERYVLPETGGVGCTPFYMIGTVMLISAFIYIALPKRRRERRKS